MCDKLVGNRKLLSSASPNFHAGAYGALDRIVRGILSDGSGWDDNNGDWRETALELANAFSPDGLPPEGQGGVSCQLEGGDVVTLECVCV